MAEPVALAALALDAVLGWPDAVYRRIGHPVGLFARLIQACERGWNRSRFSNAARRGLGILTVALLIAFAGGAGWALTCLFHRAFGAFGWVAVAMAAWPALAQRSLFDHVRPVARHLGRGNPEEARHAVAMIVGRDTRHLDEASIARAAIESLAESFCDGVAAPLFWLLVGGLPGIWIYKAINTADSLIGHKEERWRCFGWAAARADDLLNLAPARIGGVLICLAGGGGWRIMLRDARKHASPNAGWTEAAMAGALHVRLAGPVAYDGIMHDKEWIGGGEAGATASHIDGALRIYLRACLLLWIIAGGMAWAL
ncbi:adenosylcobinamide-phosphate synthase CbiB [Tsuneonella sp. CC-YZS046]|uniref:adenosylcobinamide-phosphate synthase CbiB n=1 Tax=Tsuneonella sp. CC-YZS046 TaxID=3042152 RepID=UPI002D78A6EB|nr:adenosylcobinamide-phosphate synthase CbiB [Tsuneonella sp. CC-YZS046]WRO66260.1 adenosylcobinamide-phosphate synthase CbiB [Tsuneonella sp. CC-YZS046]